MTFAWSSREMLALKVMWNDGLSASEIAARLGPDATRNAVLGKVHRMKDLPCALPARVPGYKGSKRNDVDVKLKRKAIASVTLAKAPLKPMRVIAMPPHPVSALQANQCKWPIGGPRAPDFSFCGHDSLTDKSYCEFHAQIAYVKPKGRAR